MIIKSFLDIQPVFGISGFRLITNSHFQPKFQLQSPGNWQYNILPSPDSKGFIISIRGPLNEGTHHYTCLFITSEEDIHPQYSLDEICKDSILNKSFTESSILFNKQAVVSNKEAREVRIITKNNLNQWIVLRFESHIINITYSSSEDSFEELFHAYAKAIKSFTFLP